MKELKEKFNEITKNYTLTYIGYVSIRDAINFIEQNFVSKEEALAKRLFELANERKRIMSIISQENYLFDEAHIQPLIDSINKRIMDGFDNPAEDLERENSNLRCISNGLQKQLSEARDAERYRITNAVMNIPLPKNFYLGYRSCVLSAINPDITCEQCKELWHKECKQTIEDCYEIWIWKRTYPTTMQKEKQNMIVKFEKNNS